MTMALDSCASKAYTILFIYRKDYIRRFASKGFACKARVIGRTFSYTNKAT